MRLFDIQGDKVVASEHCYTIKWLKAIIDAYPKEHSKVFAYLQYMCSYSEVDNPFIQVKEDDREEMVLDYLGAKFSVEDDLIVTAMENCKKLFDLPSRRAWVASKIALDKLSDYLTQAEVTTGKDGSGDFILKAIEKLPNLNAACNQVYKDFQEEVKTQVRGDKYLSQV